MKKCLSSLFFTQKHRASTNIHSFNISVLFLIDISYQLIYYKFEYVSITPFLSPNLAKCILISTGLFFFRPRSPWCTSSKQCHERSWNASLELLLWTTCIFTREKNLKKQKSEVEAICNTNKLVVSTHLKNISQIGNLPQVGVKITNIWNHHPEFVTPNKPLRNADPFGWIFVRKKLFFLGALRFGKRGEGTNTQGEYLKGNLRSSLKSIEL